jgi:hypothetical protein
MSEVFGRAFLAGRTIFTLVEICNELGMRSFDHGRVDYESFRLRALFRPVDRETVALEHSVFQEFLAAEYLRTPEGREHASALGESVILTEQTRAFLHLARRPASEDRDDGVLAPGTYLLGPSHHLLLRRITHAVRFDRYPVTVERYRRFQAEVAQHGSAAWDHPDTPAEHTHEPWHARLRVPDYYSDPAYTRYPAICVSWWSAYAFARFEGKRLATSVEWEAAARDGRQRVGVDFHGA